MSNVHSIVHNVIEELGIVKTEVNSINHTNRRISRPSEIFNDQPFQDLLRSKYEYVYEGNMQLNDFLGEAERLFYNKIYQGLLEEVVIMGIYKLLLPDYNIKKATPEQDKSSKIDFIISKDNDNTKDIYFQVKQITALSDSNTIAFTNDYITNDAIDTIKREKQYNKELGNRYIHVISYTKKLSNNSTNRDIYLLTSDYNLTKVLSFNGLQLTNNVINKVDHYAQQVIKKLPLGDCVCCGMEFVKVYHEYNNNKYCSPRCLFEDLNIKTKFI